MRTNINYRFTKPPNLNKIIFLSMLQLLWMNVMLDFINTGFADLRRTERERNFQNKNIRLQSDLNHQNCAPFECQAPETIRLRRLRCLNVFKTFTEPTHMV